VLPLETGDRESVRPSVEGSSILPCATTVSKVLVRSSSRRVNTHIAFAEVLFYHRTSAKVELWFG
jgi:hypothetical protein